MVMVSVTLVYNKMVVLSMILELLLCLVGYRRNGKEEQDRSTKWTLFGLLILVASYEEHKTGRTEVQE